MGDLLDLAAYRESRPARAAPVRLELPEMIDIDGAIANLEEDLHALRLRRDALPLSSRNYRWVCADIERFERELAEQQAFRDDVLSALDRRGMRVVRDG